MATINKITWGNVIVDDQKYGQVLIVNGQVSERDRARLKKLFGTTHSIGNWEKKKLISGQPEVILIASGWHGVLKVDPEFKSHLASLKIKLKVVLTPRVVKEYHQLVENGKKVNALIHTTC